MSRSWKDRQGIHSFLAEEAREQTSPEASAATPGHRNYYALLNLSKEAPEEDIRAAYKRLSLIYHTDRHLNGEDKEVATQTFLLIKEAYDTLIDPGKRAAYNLYGVDGADFGKELYRPGMSAEQLQNIIRVKKEKTNEIESLRQNNITGVFSMGLDASVLLDSPEFEQPLPSKLIIRSRKPQRKYLPEVSNLLIQQKLSIPVNQSSDFNVGGVLVMAGNRGAANIDIEYEHRLSDSMDFEARVKLGNQQEIGMNITRRLSPDDTITSGFSLSKNGLEIESKYERTLTEKMSGSIGIVSAEGTEVNASLTKRFEKASGTFTLRSAEEPSLSILGTYQPLSNMFINANASARFGGGEIEILCGQKISGRTKFISGLNISSNGVALRFMVNRLRQKYYIPVVLSKTVSVWSVLSSVAIPALVMTSIRQLIYVPKTHKREQRESSAKKAEEEAAKTDALRHIQQSASRVQMMRSIEHGKNGLVILLALIGEPHQIDTFNLSPDEIGGRFVSLSGQTFDVSAQPAVANVTDPLQSLVVESKLNVLKFCYVGIPGIYNPSPDSGLLKLRVWYLFQGNVHTVDIAENEDMHLPRI